MSNQPTGAAEVATRLDVLSQAMAEAIARKMRGHDTLRAWRARLADPACVDSVAVAELVHWADALAAALTPDPPDPAKEARTTALGLIRYANDYRKAAEAVKTAQGEHRMSVVPYMLASHSMELALKAFLRTRGATLGDLLRWGHDLPKLRKRALKRGLARLWPEARYQIVGDVLRLLEDANEDQALRYIVNGSTTLPTWPAVSGVALGLVQSLQVWCLRHSEGKERAAKIVATRGKHFLTQEP